MKLGDQEFSLQLRNVIEKIVGSVIDRERPLPRIGAVTEFNIFTRKAMVLFPGDTEPSEVKFPRQLVPTKADEDPYGANVNDANVVEVSGRPGNYWITNILSETNAMQSPHITKLTLGGGTFNHEKHATHLATSVDLPETDGRWVLLGDIANPQWGTSYAQGVAQIDMVISHIFFTGRVKTYSFPIRGSSALTAWTAVLPVSDQGNLNGYDFQLEVRNNPDDVNALSMRIRRTRSGTGTTPGGYRVSAWITGDFWNGWTGGGETGTDAAPTEVFGRARMNTEDGNNPVDAGPYFNSIQHAVTSRIQANLMEPDTVSWDGTDLKWTGEWVAYGFGKGSLSSTGRIRIPMPPAGTAIPLHGSSIWYEVNVSANGINLPFGGSDQMNALYYEPQYLIDGTGSTGRFHMVSDGIDFTVPSHWILIALYDGPRRATGNTVKLGSGRLIDFWRPLPLNGAWVAYDAAGTGYEQPGYKREGNTVFLRGLMRYGTTNLIATLPAGFRPSETKILTVPVGSQSVAAASAGTAHYHLLSNAAARVDVAAGGGLTFAVTPVATITGAGQVTNAYVSLDTSFAI